MILFLSDLLFFATHARQIRRGLFKFLQKNTRIFVNLSNLSTGRRVCGFTKSKLRHYPSLEE